MGVWLDYKDVRLCFPEFLDGLVGCFESERLELLGEVVGGEPVADVPSQLVDRAWPLVQG